MPKCPNCERETKRTTDWACQWCGYPLLSESYETIPKTFQQFKDEALQKAKPEREPDSEAGPESELETAMEAELIVEPVAEPAKDREPAPPSDTEPTTKPQAEPVVKPKPAEEPKSIPEASVIPLGEPHREQLPKPEKAAELQPELEPGPEPIPTPTPEPVPVPKPIKKPEPVAEELTVDELIEAYEQDAPAADSRFLDKRLMVTGVIALVDVRETLDTPYVRLAGAEGDISRSVKCLFDKEHAPALSQLEKGQTATVQGKFNGSLIAIRMIDCALA